MKSVIILLHVWQSLCTVVTWIKYILSPFLYTIFILSPLLYIISFLTADLDTKDLSLCTLMTCIKYELSPLLYLIYIYIYYLPLYIWCLYCLPFYILYLYYLSFYIWYIYIISPYIFDICIICPFIFDIYIISLVHLIFILPPIVYLICLLTQGLDTQDLTLRPTDQHLVRLAGLVSVDTFYKFVIHLGLSDISWNNILVQYQGYDQKVVNFMALCKWRQQKHKEMETTSFKDLSVALTAINHRCHVLCKVGNN